MKKPLNGLQPFQGSQYSNFYPISYISLLKGLQPLQGQENTVYFSPLLPLDTSLPLNSPFYRKRWLQLRHVQPSGHSSPTILTHPDPDKSKLAQ